MGFDWKDHIRLVMIAVGWIAFYSMAGGLALFGIYAHMESSACMDTYNAYLQQCSSCKIAPEYQFGETPTNASIEDIRKSTLRPGQE